MQGTYQRLPLDGLGTDSQPNRCMEHSSAVGAWTEEQSMRVSHAYIRRSTFAGVVGQERETLFAGCSVLLVGLTIVEVPCYLEWSIVCNIDNELRIFAVLLLSTNRCTLKSLSLPSTSHSSTFFCVYFRNVDSP